MLDILSTNLTCREPNNFPTIRYFKSKFAGPPISFIDAANPDNGTHLFLTQIFPLHVLNTVYYIRVVNSKKTGPKWESQNGNSAKSRRCAT